MKRGVLAAALSVTLFPTSFANEYINAVVNHHVATLPDNLYMDRDIECLALNVYHEARGEPILGQIAVAKVTINRFERSNNTICEIVYRRGQFSWTSKPQRRPVGNAWKQAQVIAWLVITQPELVNDPTNGSLYFHSSRMTPHEFRNFQRVVTIGNHKFYKERQLVEIAESR